MSPGDRDVLSSLPRTRATRRSAKRVDAATRDAAPPPAGWATPTDDPAPEHGAELIGTAIQAVGELAEIGVLFGVRKIRQAVSRVPHP